MISDRVLLTQRLYRSAGGYVEIDRSFINGLRGRPGLCPPGCLPSLLARAFDLITVAGESKPARN